MCQAQTPTPCPDDIQATRTAEETLLDMSQPGHYSNDETVMHRYKFKPSGPGPWPTVLMIPPAVFKNGYDDGTPEERLATKDVVGAGFLVFQIEHRLAPDGLLGRQHQHDTSPEGIAWGSIRSKPMT